MPHPALADEQSYIDHAYRCLEAMRAHTARLADLTESAAQETDSAAAQVHLKRRLHTLDGEVDGLSFGRLDDEAGETWYVGRRHVEDEGGDPVVVDWRADVSTPFYRATAADPLGLERRRRFTMTGRHIDDLFDEVFDDPDSIAAHAAGGRGQGIPDPLLAELERSRTGEMRDIVATIAAEQDLVIRAPLNTCLIVQGGPGTGKTAVGLHRAAFLLYEHRGRLDREGVLVIGPNPLFLRYIAQVLPSLGETAVRQTTLERLLAGTQYRVRATDSPSAAQLKGDVRMAQVLANAVAAARRLPEEPLDITTEWGRVRLDPDDVAAAVDDIAARGVAHNIGRNALRTQLIRRCNGVASADLKKALDRMWPALSAQNLVRRLLTSATALRNSSDGLLDRRELRLLQRPSSRRADQEPWTEADLVLLDEAQWLIAGSPPTYGHVVLDEAQDTSAMGLRALARRCPSGSLTVLGDLAQATAPAAQHSWEQVADHLGGTTELRSELQRVDLDLGYRVPAPIMDMANGLLAEAAPEVTPCRSVRADGLPPVMIEVTSDDELVAALQKETARLADDWTSVGIVAPAEIHPQLRDLPATIVPPTQAKGLEFDAVVVADPAVIAHGQSTAEAAMEREYRDDARGLRLLYVALTRAVQELVVVDVVRGGTRFGLADRGLVRS